MTDQKPAPLPCPFCGSKPIVELGKLTSCQLHGEPSQAVVIRCKSNECRAKPSVSAGDKYNGGEAKARGEAITVWNKREASSHQQATITAQQQTIDEQKAAAATLWKQRDSYKQLADERQQAMEALYEPGYFRIYFVLDDGKAHCWIMPSLSDAAREFEEQNLRIMPERPADETRALLPPPADANAGREG